MAVQTLTIKKTKHAQYENLTNFSQIPNRQLLFCYDTTHTFKLKNVLKFKQTQVRPWNSYLKPKVMRKAIRRVLKAFVFDTTHDLYSIAYSSINRTLIYFPIVALQVTNSDEYSTDWPFIENQFEKRYSERISLGYKLRTWKAKLRVYSNFTNQSPVTWTQNTVCAVGKYMKPVAGDNYVFMCAVAGITGNSEPSWNKTPEGITIDGTVTWVCWLNNQLTTLINFINNRYGRVGSFYVWMPLYAAWVQVALPAQEISLVPIKPGNYTMADAEITFTEVYGSAP